MMNENSNFKEGLKGTSLFGGVSIINIFINILKSKVLAILLGPSGMGVYGMFTSAVDLINKGTNFGIRTSAVRNVSQAFSTNDVDLIAHSVAVTKKVVLMTGLLGMLLFIVLAPFWSKMSFGNYEFVPAFSILSLYLLLTQLYDGQNVIMQGTKKYKNLAKSNVLGSVVSLVFSVPFFYFMGIAGIAPSIVVAAFVKFLFAYYYAKRGNIKTIKVGLRKVFSEGQGMINLGFYIALSGILTSLSGYVVRAYISNVGGLEDVGLFTSGFYIVSVYTGIVFSGMGTEFYPRLSSMTNDNELFVKAINDQIVLALILISPLICLFLILGDIGVILLYSTDFLGITWMINYAMIGMLLKAPGWCMAYAILSKGSSQIYFFSELVSIIVTTALNIVLYKYYGIDGLGVSFILTYLFYMFLELFVCVWSFNYSFDWTIIKSIILLIVLPLICLVITSTLSDTLRYTLGVIVVCISLYYSYKRISSVIDIKRYIRR